VIIAGADVEQSQEITPKMTMRPPILQAAAAEKLDNCEVTQL
jgi:hypothetical protein